MQKPPIEQPASPVTPSQTARTLPDAFYTRAQGEAPPLQFRKKARKKTVEGVAYLSWSAFNPAERSRYEMCKRMDSESWLEADRKI
ncbi:hypothetical protein BPAE_0128g00030 [Botrytis paeoniae]|uniref:Uncharacterized protein n=1 Tax=Botrytis paeoniae TaxID=278948 RepID=A0A4Z1FKK9_9HELO|nr:hypothetical protein BPAE_0128g00030 [Botrytis paeoniae]